MCFSSDTSRYGMGSETPMRDLKVRLILYCNKFSFRSFGRINTL